MRIVVNNRNFYTDTILYYKKESSLTNSSEHKLIMTYNNAYSGVIIMKHDHKIKFLINREFLKNIPIYPSVKDNTFYTSIIYFPDLKSYLFNMAIYTEDEQNVIHIKECYVDEIKKGIDDKIEVSIIIRCTEDEYYMLYKN